MNKKNILTIALSVFILLTIFAPVYEGTNVDGDGKPMDTANDGSGIGLLQELTKAGGYPVFDLLGQTATDVDVNGRLYYVGNDRVPYQNQPIYQVVEWSEKIPVEIVAP